MQRLFLSLFLCIAMPVLADASLYPFTNEADRARFQQFNEELRCPTCQNQNLAGSASMIAEDLRGEIYEQIQAGKSDREITDYMIARYGDYILYRPRLTPATAILYIAPVVFLVTGIVVLLLVVRRRRLNAQVMEKDTALSEAERQRINALLNRPSGEDRP